MENLELKIEKKENVENLVNEAATEKITNEKIESSLNYDLLTKKKKKAIDEFIAKINVSDSAQVLQYGAKAQTQISQFSDSVLENIKTRSAGEVGDLLANLVGQIKSFDSDITSSEKKTGLAKLFSNAKKELNTIVAKYSKIETNIDTIEKNLENHKLQMLKDITIFDTMYEKNLDYFKKEN